jgi:hypothetical protein
VTSWTRGCHAPYIVLRIDDFHARQQWSASRDYLDQPLADAEMARLNDLNSANGARYHLHVTPQALVARTCAMSGRFAAVPDGRRVSGRGSLGSRGDRNT